MSDVAKLWRYAMSGGFRQAIKLHLETEEVMAQMRAIYGVSDEELLELKRQALEIGSVDG